MAAEDIKALAHRVIEEVFNQRKPEVLDEVIADSYVENTRLAPDWPEGRDALKRAASIILAGFPDFHYTIEDEVVESNKIAQRLTATETHQGEFLGIPPTGKHLTWSEIHIGKVEGGKFVEHWANIDQLGIMQQLGLIPHPEQTAV